MKEKILEIMITILRANLIGTKITKYISNGVKFMTAYKLKIKCDDETRDELNRLCDDFVKSPESKGSNLVIWGHDFDNNYKPIFYFDKNTNTKIYDCHMLVDVNGAVTSGAIITPVDKSILTYDISDDAIIEDIQYYKNAVEISLNTGVKLLTFK